MSGGTVPVSIGLPVYNGEAFVERALKSLLGQTFGEFELIVSDNGSDDRTPEICRAHAAGDARIRYVRHAHNRGAAWNYNFVAREAAGTYFKWAAHDDECAPAFLERCVAAFDDAGDDVVLCYPRTVLIEESGAVFAKFLDNLSLESVKPANRLYRLLRTLGRCNPVFGLIRRDALHTTRLIGAYIGSDRVLLAELCLAGRFREVPEYLFLRRMHEGISTRAANTDEALLRWFDPAGRGKPLAAGRLRLSFEYLRAIGRARLGARERATCVRALARAALARPDAESRAFSQMVARVDARGVDERLRRVKELLSAGDLDAAERKCAALLDARPFTTPALHLRSVIRYRRGDLAGARAAALAALWRNDREAAFHNMLGVIEQAAGDDRAAVAAFERAVALDAGYGEALENLGLVCARAGDAAKAEEYAARARAARARQ